MKYIYGGLFAATVGLMTWLVLSHYVESMAAICTGVVIALLVSPLCVKYMAKESIRENML